jgi:hypothetical protein
MVNETTKCAANCDQGDGSAAATEKYAACQQKCISDYFFTSGAAGATGTATGTTATGTGATATATGTGKSATGTATGSATRTASGTAT